MTNDERNWRDLYAIIQALHDWPKMPDPLILHLLGEIGSKHYDDGNRGKRLQSELGPEAIPFNSECEWGAGLWDRITNGTWR